MKPRGFKSIEGISLSALLIASTIIIFSTNAYASEQDTVDAGVSSSSDEVAAASGSNRFVVWRDFSPGNSEILFKRSTDGGATWGSKINLSNNGGPSSNPSIAVSGSNVYVAWVDKTPSNYETFFKRSTDNGATWKPTINLSNNPGPSGIPLVAAIGSNAYVVWEQQNAEGTANDIFFRRSADNGATWKLRVNLSNDGSSQRPAISVSDSNIYVSWNQFANGPCAFGPVDIFFRRSTDNGASWEPKINLSDDPCEISEDQILAFSGSNIYVAWIEILPGGFEIFFARSVDSGSNWDSPVNLTQNPSPNGPLSPYIAASGSKVYLIWVDHEADGNLAFRRSLDGGTTWKPKVYLTEFGAAANPILATSGSQVYAIWEDYTPGNADVSFRRSLDSGKTWKSKVNLSNTAGDSLNLIVALKGTTIFVLWEDYSKANPEVYLRRSTDSGATWKVKVNLSNNAGISGSPQIAV